MKKMLLITTLVMVLVLAFAAPAFAKYAGYSASTQYVPWAEAQSMASLNADAALMARGPHAGYATTTIKCAVCHSVHRGGSDLLNEGAACAYCHTNDYYGGGAVASNLISWSGGGPHNSRCVNDDCHGGPHGVGASTYDGPASKLITAKGDAELEELATANGVATSEFATWSATTRVLATAGVCQRAGCHSNSMMGVVTSGAETTVTVGVDKKVTGHRVIAAATTSWNADSSFSSTKTNLTIAYKPVEYCNSCHALKDDNNAGKAAFPHSINGVVDSAAKADGTWRVAVWLTAAPNSDTTATAVGPYNQYVVTPRGNPVNDISSAAGSTILDGQCLKCHRSSTAGLGITY
ncbi:MAG: hypothetical protein IBX63_06925 [Coriobacteriia bacterium]|nr:hypothetical protein [Coriobacteriia bacterium]